MQPLMNTNLSAFIFSINYINCLIISFLSFLPLLQYEQDEEESLIRERLGTWSLPKLKDEGYTLTGLSAYWLEGTRFGKPMASFSLGPGLHLPEHKFLYVLHSSVAHPLSLRKVAGMELEYFFPG